MGKLLYEELREEMCVVARLMWERRLTNAAGGNFAVRVTEKHILITPSMMSERRHCLLEAKDILLMDYDKNVLDGEGELSREGDMHLYLLTKFDNIGASIHAHPFNCMPFVSAGKPIPNVTEATMGRGEVGCIPFTKAYTPELAAAVAQYYEDRRALAERKPIGVILPLHGVVVTGPDIYGAYSMLERIECDAYCTITSSLLAQAIPEAHETLDMEIFPGLSRI
ncbi:MAG: class II aldolase/adducin family protein [Clostridiales Family XIII bacterium]|jgi:L-fuculose-phosphate aldolase|nr:class II aldolase/adducin family protein [Clostridiales Family XIII bacterium]